jgi:DNA-binding Xre family transcriptional regulator
MVVTEVRERLSASKQVAQKFDMEKFNLRKLNDAEVKSVKLKYQVCNFEKHEL